MRIQDLMLGLLPVSPITGHQTSKRKLYADETGKRFSREDIFAGRYFRERIFSREDIFAGRYFRVNSKFAKISSRENISNSFFAKFSSRENKVLYSTCISVFCNANQCKSQFNSKRGLECTKHTLKAFSFWGPWAGPRTHEVMIGARLQRSAEFIFSISLSISNPPS